MLQTIPIVLALCLMLTVTIWYDQYPIVINIMLKLVGTLIHWSAGVYLGSCDNHCRHIGKE